MEPCTLSERSAHTSVRKGSILGKTQKFGLKKVFSAAHPEIIPRRGDSVFLPAFFVNRKFRALHRYQTDHWSSNFRSESTPQEDYSAGIENRKIEL